MDSRTFYSRISRAYDLIADTSEGACRDRGVDALGISAGERVLEIGFGTGHALERMSDAAGPAGRVYGMDIADGMAAVALARVGAHRTVRPVLGDGCRPCFREAVFDAAFMSFSLELFEAQAIPIVLAEVRRMLKPSGRLGVVAMADTDQANPMVEIYQWLHRHFPHFVDCRPIDVVGVLDRAGFAPTVRHAMSIWGLPVTAVVAVKREGQQGME